jgi:NAD-dependent dihydropyrimidine dehydrogenase PreA subunit
MSIKIDYDLCDNSGTCEMVCPEDVLEQDAKRMMIVSPQACTNCWVCVDNCTSGALEIE